MARLANMNRADLLLEAKNSFILMGQNLETLVMHVGQKSFDSSLIEKHSNEQLHETTENTIRPRSVAV